VTEDESQIFFQDYINAEGDQYVGDSVVGKRDGQGKMIVANGQEFIGEFKVSNMIIVSAFVSLFG